MSLQFLIQIILIFEQFLRHILANILEEPGEPICSDN